MPHRLAPLTWIWLGATGLFAAVVAPAAFEVLPTRALAGLLVGRVLPVLFWSGALVAIVLALTHNGWRRMAALLMLAACLAAQLGVAPRIQALRAALGPDLEAIPASDARRVAFGRLHGVSVALLGVGVLGAMAIAFGSLRPTIVPDRRHASGTPAGSGVPMPIDSSPHESPHPLSPR